MQTTNVILLLGAVLSVVADAAVVQLAELIASFFATRRSVRRAEECRLAKTARS